MTNSPQNFNLSNDNELNLRYLVQMVMQRIHIVLIIFLVVFIGTVLYTLNQDKVYSSQTQILIDDNMSAGSVFDQMTPFRNTDLVINNEIQIITSRSIAERTVNSLIVEYPLDSLYLFDKGVEEAEKSLKSRLKKILGKKDVEIRTLDQKKRSYVGRLQEYLIVTPVRETQTINISIESRDPNEAAIILNELVHQYYAQDLERVSNSVGNVRGFLEEQLRLIEPQLEEVEKRLSSFLEKEGIVDLEENSRQLIVKSSEFEAQLFTAEAELNIVVEQLMHIKDRLSEKEIEILDNRLQVANPLILSLRDDIARSEKQYIEWQAKGIVNDNTRNQKALMEIKEKRLNEETNYLIKFGYLPGSEDPLSVNQSFISQITELETKKVTLQARVEEYTKLDEYYDDIIESIPATSISYLHLERERQTQERIYLLMKERYEESRIQEASQISSVYIIDNALPNYLPIKPRTKVNILLGFVLGIALGVGVILIREFVDNSVRSKEDLEKLGLTVMGIIPSMFIDKSKKALDKKFSGDNDYRSRLITHFKPRSPISESFRSLRTNLDLALPDKKIKSIVVTSGGAQEGKSTVISNLAITFAQLGMKVLLVDADMRKPMVNKMFKTSKKPGLANLITKRAKLDDAIRKTEIDNLDVIPAGTLPPNPSELLGSDSMIEIFEEMKSRYDKIFFDAPPLMAVTDSAILGALTDGVLLVSRAGVAQSEVITHLKQEMNNSNIRIVGTVLNDVNPKNTSSGYYYYYQRYYFDKYYGEEK